MTRGTAITILVGLTLGCGKRSDLNPETSSSYLKSLEFSVVPGSLLSTPELTEVGFLGLEPVSGQVTHDRALVFTGYATKVPAGGYTLSLEIAGKKLQGKLFAEAPTTDKIIRDEVTLFAPKDWQLGGIVEVSIATSNLPQQKLTTFSLAKRTRPRPQYTIHKATTPIVLDGQALELDWQKVTRSGAFVTAEGGQALDASTHARLLWDDQNLYAFIEIKDEDIFSSFHGRDDTLWKEDVIELFIDADRNGRGYIELQVNPNNAIFDAFFPQTRAQDHHFEWNSKMQTAVKVFGTTDNRDDRDIAWNVELALPWADVVGMAGDMVVDLPPKLGDTWRLNIVRGELPKKGGFRASTWNPITIGDFHALGRMLTVMFSDSVK